MREQVLEQLADNKLTRERVLACAVHGVLSGPAIGRIKESPIDTMIVTIGPWTKVTRRTE